jgi:hypothetical protein
MLACMNLDAGAAGTQDAAPDATLTAVGAVSLRLMAGSVSRKTMESLRRTLVQSPAEYPWQVVTQAILAEVVDPEKLVHQGLRAQRDWLLRGGREDPGRPLGVKAKTLLAKMLTQLIVLGIFSLLTVALLVLAKQEWPAFDIYRLLDWLQTTFPQTFPRPR